MQSEEFVVNCKIPTEHFPFEWTFRCDPDRDDHYEVTSETFTSPKNGHVKWYLSCMPNGKNKETCKFVSLSLVRQLDSNVHICDAFAKCLFQLVDRQGLVILSKLQDVTALTTHCNSVGVDKFVRRQKVAKRWLDEAECSIRVRVEVTVGFLYKCQQNENIMQLTNDLDRLLVDGRHSDVTFKVSGKSIRAHRNILAARSTVFEAMFKHDMREKQSSDVAIDDMSEKVFVDLLRFVYTGQVNDLSTVDGSLLVAADRYQLTRLKQVCETSLSRQMTVDNAADFLVLADLTNSKLLKQTAIDFINSNRDSVKEAQTLKPLMKEHPHLILELYEKVL